MGFTQLRRGTTTCGSPTALSTDPAASTTAAWPRTAASATFPRQILERTGGGEVTAGSVPAADLEELDARGRTVEPDPATLTPKDEA